MAAIEIPGFRILSIIGQGGMGTVYKAKQLSMDRLVAIKVLSADLCKDQTFATRFVREARSLAKLNHPNIVSAIDVGECNGVYYYVMEFIEGRSVSDHIKAEGRLQEFRALEIAIEVAQGLSHAARHKMIHRDIKPQNLLLTPDGRVKICDFGLAKQTEMKREESDQVTIATTFLGTPMYASPEQAKGEKEIDVRSDLYSLGATLFYMLTGQPPFNGNSGMEIMAKHLTEPPPSPRRRSPDITDFTCRIVLKLLQKDPAARHQNPDELIADLQRARKSSVIAPSARPGARVSRRIDTRTHPVQKSSAAPIVVGIVLAVVALGLGLAFLAGGSKPPRTPPNPPPVAAKPEPRPPSLPAPDPAEEQFKRDLRAYLDRRKELWDREAPQRVSEPYETLSQFIEKSKGTSLQARWVEEQKKFISETDEKIAPIWTRFKGQAEIPAAVGQFGKALDALSEFPRELAAFAEQKPTAAGAELNALRADLERKIQSKLDQDMKAIQTARAAKNFEEAWRVAQAMALYLDASRLDLLMDQRLALVQAEYDSIMVQPPTAAASRKAQDRMNDVAAKQATHAPVAALAKELAARALKDFEAYLKNAQIKAAEAFAVLRSRLEEALSRRDTPMARKILAEFMFGEKYKTEQAALRATMPGVDALRSTLEQKSVIADASAFENQVDKLRPDPTTPAGEAILYARFSVLLEAFYSHALAGLDSSRTNSARLRSALTPALKGASRLDEVTSFSAVGISVAAEIKKNNDISKVILVISPYGENSMDHEDVVMFAKVSIPATDPALPIQIALHYYFMKMWAKAAEALEKVNDPMLASIRERVLSEVAKLPPPEPKPADPEPPKEPAKKPPKAVKAPKYPFKGRWKELSGGLVEVTYDFSDAIQLEDFETGTFFGQNGVKAEWKNKALRLEGQGTYLWKALTEDDVTIEVTYTSDNEGFGLLVHAEGDNRQGYLSYIDFDTSFGGQWAKGFFNDTILTFKLPLDFRDWRSINPLARAQGAAVTKNARGAAWMRRKPDSVEAGKDTKKAEGKNNEYAQGRTGILMGESNLTIHTIKITAKVNAAWLKEQGQ